MSQAMSPESDVSGAVASLFQEIAVSLDRLLNSGEGTVVDLQALPFLTEEERQHLQRLLGQGEVNATVAAMGPTEVMETAYPGVWWVTYYGADGDVVAERIEVARMPGILPSQDPDIRAGLGRLREHQPEPAPREGGDGEPAIRWKED